MPRHVNLESVLCQSGKSAGHVKLLIGFDFDLWLIANLVARHVPRKPKQQLWQSWDGLPLCAKAMWQLTEYCLLLVALA
jgi:hypothetical protein